MSTILNLFWFLINAIFVINVLVIILLTISWWMHLLSMNAFITVSWLKYIFYWFLTWNILSILFQYIYSLIPQGNWDELTFIIPSFLSIGTIILSFIFFMIYLFLTKWWYENWWISILILLNIGMIYYVFYSY